MPSTSKVKGAKTKSRYFRSKFGEIHLGDCLEVLSASLKPESVDLIVTSPPFGLVRKKEYGNADASNYVNWFRPFGEMFCSLLKPSGSFVIDIGGAWIPGQPTRSLYHFELLIMLCKEQGFHLAQEFYWWNPSKLPTPAEWVTVRRIRAKDAVNCIWWLSKTPWPKSSNLRILQPYSDSMVGLLKNGYKAKQRPSGHDISTKFAKNNGAAIPPNLIAVANTESNSRYLQYCNKNKIKPHPARFPAAIPEFFIRMLTDPQDVVVDPFAGSCTTGEAAEKLERGWICCDLEEEYLKGALGRFSLANPTSKDEVKQAPAYQIYHPSCNWNGCKAEPLPEDGGKAWRLEMNKRKRK